MILAAVVKLLVAEVAVIGTVVAAVIAQCTAAAAGGRWRRASSQLTGSGGEAWTEVGGGSRRGSRSMSRRKSGSKCRSIVINRSKSRSNVRGRSKSKSRSSQILRLYRRVLGMQNVSGVEAAEMLEIYLMSALLLINLI